VPSPLHRSFDYLPPRDCDPRALRPGIRLRVPFGRGTLVGILLGVTQHSDVAPARLRAALEVLDRAPVLDGDILAMVSWASAYYHHPIGEALSCAIPARLRRSAEHRVRHTPLWRLTDTGRLLDPESLARAPRQAEALRRLRQSRAALGREALEVPSRVLRNLEARGWIERVDGTGPAAGVTAPSEPARRLNTAQCAAVQAVEKALYRYTAFLLEGVTGSGKTEVYLQIIERVLRDGRQALVLVPEIGLTPQLVARFQRRFPVPLAILHSGLGDCTRLDAWQMARTGAAPVIIGTRSAIFTPLRRPGIVIVDEEHDVSLKQQDGFRYSARDLAVWRAHRARVPVVLGSATPSLESLFNVQHGRYRHLRLPERTGAATMPDFELLDMRGQRLENGLSEPLHARIGRHLDHGGQVLLFLNRRGYAPTLLCHHCGWVATCDRCDARYTLHRRSGRLRCHHCGAERRVDSCCPACGGDDLRPLGQGTERVEQAIAARYPDHELIRIDRDTTRRKGDLEALLARAREGSGRILLGTQMLAKGHHFPDVTLVCIIDADQGLFGSDFRASERMAQLIIQVAGRAGRAGRPGTVVIQTHYPGHPLLQMLVRHGYARFAAAALEERTVARLPPCTSLALLRAEAVRQEAPMAFLEEARALAEASASGGIELWGPVPAPMERRAGRHRGQLILQAAQRPELHHLLETLVLRLEGLKSARRVRWSLDVDPVDTL
jgi:primosomal protein N' (replication factor Y)